MFEEEPPTNNYRQPEIVDGDIRTKVKAKIKKVLDKGYIELADIELIESFMHFFHVPKGEEDIRMVYDGTKSGLNDSIWSPWFALPTAESMVRWVVAGLWLANNNLGDCFLNFPLHPDLQNYCGIDLSALFPELQERERQGAFARWLVCAMGLKASPYCCVRGCTVAKYEVLGDPNDQNNPFA